jgi:hypothetical protein
MAINKKKKALLKDEVSFYRLEENTLDYILFRIRELTGKLYQNTKKMASYLDNVAFNAVITCIQVYEISSIGLSGSNIKH